MKSMLLIRKASLLLLMVLFTVLLNACSGDGGNSSTAPSISGLSISPSAVYVNDSGGQTDVRGTFDFTDPEGNLSSVILTVLDTDGQSVVSNTIEITNVSGLKSGKYMA